MLRSICNNVFGTEITYYRLEEKKQVNIKDIFKET